MHKKLTMLWFILGLGNSLQIVASLSITELIILSAAPFLFFKSARNMKRDGVMPLFILSVFVILGCVIACVVNQTQPQFVLRGLAVACLISSVIIFSHWIIRSDPNGFKWFFVGAAISLILCTFVFQRSNELRMYGETADEIMDGTLFWVERISACAMTPIKGWYLHIPSIISASTPVGLSVFSLLASSSGRSAALASIGFFALVLIGGRSQKSMQRISKHFAAIVLCAIFGILAIHSVYKVSASQGWLGEKALKKYEQQTQGDSSIMRLLLGGRADSFIGLLACRDKPIIGWGPWAIDEGWKYRDEFIFRFGTTEDYKSLLEAEAYYMTTNKVGLSLISCHSHITEFWLWYGIFGLIFILYAVFVLIRYLKQDVYVVPQWFAWLACGIPGMMWHILFSPFAHRVTFPMMVVACLMARAVRKGAFQLPFEMINEIIMVERRSK